MKPYCGTFTEPGLPVVPVISGSFLIGGIDPGFSIKIEVFSRFE